MHLAASPNRFWRLEFSANSGYTPGDPAYLSFDVGAGQSSDDLEAWQYNGNTWTAFPADDLTYDGNYASFTVTGLEGYAVTGIDVVPEPSTLALLAAGAIGLAGYGLHRRAASRTAKATAFDQQDDPTILSFPSHWSTANAARTAA